MLVLLLLEYNFSGTRLRGQVSRIGARTQEMWKNHVSLTTAFPDASLPPGDISQAAVTPDAVRRKRLVYRSKQRGWLEVGERRQYTATHLRTACFGTSFAALCILYM